MLEELRLNPWSPAARSRGRRPGGCVLTDVGAVDPSLSTGFGRRARRRSTGEGSPIQRLWRGLEEEEVG